ncbi:hypothetical protein AK812_SmicGene5461 [Symbiodinium microadriaticum]|uniref:Uncharacterized protein n=1 Tax=Symbiodinium microadriaticum TaxID=2951 RepID=A0A1Q9ETN6_SYMMI|nr:hypothetical protein AK812_SmicGene5461 [Symbiodinium microadriaticum]
MIRVIAKSSASSMSSTTIISRTITIMILRAILSFPITVTIMIFICVMHYGSSIITTTSVMIEDVEHCALAKLDQLMKFAIMCKEKAVSFGVKADGSPGSGDLSYAGFYVQAFKSKGHNMDGAALSGEEQEHRREGVLGFLLGDRGARKKRKLGWMLSLVLSKEWGMPSEVPCPTFG